MLAMRSEVLTFCHHHLADRRRLLAPPPLLDIDIYNPDLITYARAEAVLGPDTIDVEGAESDLLDVVGRIA